MAIERHLSMSSWRPLVGDALVRSLDTSRLYPPPNQSLPVARHQHQLILILDAALHRGDYTRAAQVLAVLFREFHFYPGTVFDAVVAVLRRASDAPDEATAAQFALRLRRSMRLFIDSESSPVIRASFRRRWLLHLISSGLFSEAEAAASAIVSEPAAAAGAGNDPGLLSIAGLAALLEHLRQTAPVSPLAAFVETGRDGVDEEAGGGLGLAAALADWLIGCTQQSWQSSAADATEASTVTRALPHGEAPPIDARGALVAWFAAGGDEAADTGRVPRYISAPSLRHLQREASVRAHQVHATTGYASSSDSSAAAPASEAEDTAAAASGGTTGIKRPRSESSRRPVYSAKPSELNDVSLHSHAFDAAAAGATHSYQQNMESLRQSSQQYWQTSGYSSSSSDGEGDPASAGAARRVESSNTGSQAMLALLGVKEAAQHDLPNTGRLDGDGAQPRAEVIPASDANVTAPCTGVYRKLSFSRRRIAAWLEGVTIPAAPESTLQRTRSGAAAQSVGDEHDSDGVDLGAPMPPLLAACMRHCAGAVKLVWRISLSKETGGEREASQHAHLHPRVLEQAAERAVTCATLAAWLAGRPAAALRTCVQLVKQAVAAAVAGPDKEMSGAGPLNAQDKPLSAWPQQGSFAQLLHWAIVHCPERESLAPLFAFLHRRLDEPLTASNPKISTATASRRVFFAPMLSVAARHNLQLCHALYSLSLRRPSLAESVVGVPGYAAVRALRHAISAAVEELKSLKSSKHSAVVISSSRVRPAARPQSGQGRNAWGRKELRGGSSSDSSSDDDSGDADSVRDSSIVYEPRVSCARGSSGARNSGGNGTGATETGLIAEPSILPPAVLAVCALLALAPCTLRPQQQQQQQQLSLATQGLCAGLLPPEVDAIALAMRRAEISIAAYSCAPPVAAAIAAVAGAAGVTSDAAAAAAEVRRTELLGRVAACLEHAVPQWHERGAEIEIQDGLTAMDCAYVACLAVLFEGSGAARGRAASVLPLPQAAAAARPALAAAASDSRCAVCAARQLLLEVLAAGSAS